MQRSALIGGTSLVFTLHHGTVWPPKTDDKTSQTFHLAPSKVSRLFPKQDNNCRNVTRGSGFVWNFVCGEAALSELGTMVRGWVLNRKHAQSFPPITDRVTRRSRLKGKQAQKCCVYVRFRPNCDNLNTENLTSSGLRVCVCV